MRVKTRQVLDAIAAGKALTPDINYPSIWCDEGGNVWSYGTCIAAVFRTQLILNMTYYSRTTQAHQHALSHALLREVQKQHDRVKSIITITKLPYEVDQKDLICVYVNGHLSSRWNEWDENDKSVPFTPKLCRIEYSGHGAVYDGEKWNEVGHA
jgi:hypothetical protein